MKLVAQRIFQDQMLSNLESSLDARSVFVRVRKAKKITVPIPTQQSEMIIWEPQGGGVQHALDADTLADQFSLSLDAMQAQGTLSRSEVMFTRHEPNGQSVFVVARDGARRFGFGAAMHGECTATLACTSSRFFSDLQWRSDGVDWVVTSEGEEIETGISHTEWPNIKALAAAMDRERIVAVGTKELAVFDRVAQRESLRVKFGPSYLVAVLPKGRFVSITFGKSPKCVVFERDGSVRLEVASHSSDLRVSPAGRVALGLHGLRILDPEACRVVDVLDNCTQATWLGDNRVAVIRAEPARVEVYELEDSVEKATTIKLKKVKSKVPSQIA